MNNLSLKGQWSGIYKSPRTRDFLESMSSVKRGGQGKINISADRQHNSSVLSAEGGWHALQETEWSCKKNPAQVPQGQLDSLSRVPPAGSESQSRCPAKREGSQGMEFRNPCQLKCLETMEKSSERLICKQEGFSKCPCTLVQTTQTRRNEKMP